MSENHMRESLSSSQMMLRYSSLHALNRMRKKIYPSKSIQSNASMTDLSLKRISPVHTLPFAKLPGNLDQSIWFPNKPMFLWNMILATLFRLTGEKQRRLFPEGHRRIHQTPVCILQSRADWNSWRKSTRKSQHNGRKHHQAKRGWKNPIQTGSFILFDCFRY